MLKHIHIEIVHLIYTDGINTSICHPFMASRNILQICENGGVTHSADNLSNHGIIYAVLQDCSRLNCEHNDDDNGVKQYSYKTARYKASSIIWS